VRRRPAAAWLLPPLWAGRRQDCATLLHESNAIPGKSNRWCARFADEVLLGVGACTSHFRNRRTRVTGTPIRIELTEPVDRMQARQKFGLRPDQTGLLIIGGSQGARGINQAVIDALPDLARDQIGLIHLTGPGEHEQVAADYARVLGDQALETHVAPFCHDMAPAYAAADLVLARSGASTLTELTWFGLPSLLVPYPHAAEDHQTLNAKVVAEGPCKGVLPFAPRPVEPRSNEGGAARSEPDLPAAVR
jgi:UDP-N-acetylglucosamine--N-acetylmuramyl-(pentapeptide) pyrophosphoryl-undecaprenol N-acetylglucosamine transferase